MLNTEVVRPIKLKVTFNDNASKEWECHYWICGAIDVALFRAENGKLIQFAVLGNVSRIEELE